MMVITKSGGNAMGTVPVGPFWQVIFSSEDFYDYMITKTLDLGMIVSIRVSLYEDLTPEDRLALSETFNSVATELHRLEFTPKAMFQWKCERIYTMPLSTSEHDFIYAVAYGSRAIWGDGIFIDAILEECTHKAELWHCLNTYAQKCASELAYKPSNLYPITTIIADHVKTDIESINIGITILSGSSLSPQPQPPNSYEMDAIYNFN